MTRQKRSGLEAVNCRQATRRLREGKLVEDNFIKEDKDYFSKFVCTDPFGVNYQSQVISTFFYSL